MKIFKIIMSLIIAAVAAVILSGTLSSCHTLKKNSSSDVAKSDSSTAKKKIDSTVHFKTSTQVSGKVNAHQVQQKKDYKRETTIEEFDVPHSVDKTDYGPGLITGAAADSVWRYGQLKKRTVIKEDGVILLDETESGQITDSLYKAALHVHHSTDSVATKNNRVETKVQTTKAVKNVGRGWVIVVIFVVLILGLLYWLNKKIPF